jgi:hypothetical protein
VSQGTRQRKAAVTVAGNEDEAFAECTMPSVLGDTRQRVSTLPSVRETTSRQGGRQWAPLSVPLSSALGGTQQILLLCRVPIPQHSAKKIYRCPGVPSLPSNMTWALGKIHLC